MRLKTGEQQEAFRDLMIAMFDFQVYLNSKTNNKIFNTEETDKIFSYADKLFACTEIFCETYGGIFDNARRNQN